MEIGIQRTDSQRSQNNNGPRVSFNKDVHVKRIGSRQADIVNYPTHNNLHISYNSHPSPLRVELPHNLSEEKFLKEAEFVLAQAGNVKCTAKGETDIGGGRYNDKSRNKKTEKPDKFNSLPTRKKKTKQVERSVSDASNKKLKRPTLFNLFSRKSDSNLDEIDVKKSTGKKIGRSKSDVGTVKESRDKRSVRKRNNSENEEQVTSKKKTQLSPIIEVTQRDDYFSGQNDDVNDDTDDVIINDKKGKLTLNNNRRHSAENNIKTESKENRIINKKNIIEGKINKLTSESKKTGNIGLTNHENIVPSKPISEVIKDTITTLSTHSKSLEDMHSSQQPTLKPLLTKGLTVDGMVKRLSMERFSPPPHISGPAFSYTRPNEQIIYAQEPQSIQRTSSPININGFVSQDTVDFPGKNDYPSQPKEFKTHATIDSLNRNGDSLRKPEKIKSTDMYQKYKHRNNSDEDEGLGFEYKKGMDDIPTRDQKYSPKYNNSPEDEFKSLTEDSPITPKIRDVPPEKHYIGNYDRGQADGMVDTFYPEFQDLSQRRKILESRIHSRRVGGSREFIDEISPERDFYRNPMPPAEHQRSRSIEKTIHMKNNKVNDFHRISPDDENIQWQHNRDLNDEDNLKKYHRFDTRELHTRYSPQRNHLDMISLARGVTSKTQHETKYYNDGRDGYKETFITETKIGPDGKPHITERRIKERLNSPKDKEIDLGYIEDHGDFKYDHVEPNTNYFQQKYRTEHEPKSLDSQFSDNNNRSSPEHIKQTIQIHGQNSKFELEDNYKQNPEIIEEQYLPQTREEYPQTREDYPNSLKRQKKNQRSFDKGDSGIENDYRKDSFNGESNSRWRKRTIVTDIKACEMFLKKEQKHTEETFVVPKKYNYVYRERSIDDGSHFDPRLDKYSSDTVRRSTDKHINNNKQDVIKQEKKVSGLEKVKQLFSGTNKKKTNKKTDDIIEKEKNMVREEEMRARYKEYRGQNPDHFDSKTLDISTRRRLSTPKASPIPKRNLTQKNTTSTENVAQKSGWFKSIDRLSRKKSVSKVNSKIDDDFTNNTKLKPDYAGSRNQLASSKSLRFFGDTDIESNTGYSKSSGKQRIRQEISSSTLPNPHKKLSKSAYDLNNISKDTNHVNVDRHKSASLQHLEDNHQIHNYRYNERHNSRTRNLQDISENLSVSENDHNDKKQKLKQKNRQTSTTSDKNTSSHYNQNTKYNSSLEEDMESEIPVQQKRYIFEEKNRRLHEDKGTLRNGSPSLPNKIIITESRSNSYKNDYKKPPPGPPKPARSLDRRREMSGDRIQDSSGTEGESSQQSQRSVVYLHATTVGEIPQPYILNARRKTVSRDDLTTRPKGLQPMTRTVSRSVSVLAPWKPKHLRDGYEINYSQSNEKAQKMQSSRNDVNRKNSTLSKTKKDSSTLTRPRKSSSKDEQLSDKSSSLKSSQKSSKQEYPTLQRTNHKRESNSTRNDTITRQNNKENSLNSSESSRRRWNH